MLRDHFLEDVPNLLGHRVDVLLRRLDVLDGLPLDEPAHDERLEELERHQLRQAALGQLERRARHDHRAARVVDALAEQVLAEPALLALQHVGQRLQRPVARAGDRASAAAVIEQRVDGLLEHALLVVDDDLGRAEVEQPLQAVVAVDHAPVEVVQVARGEAAAVELHHRAELRRDHRDRLEDHPLRAVLGLDERVHDLRALDRALLLLTLRSLDRVAQRRRLEIEIEIAEQVADRLRPHAAAEIDAEPVRRPEAVLELAEELLVVDDHLRLEVAEELPGLLEAIDRVDRPFARVLAPRLDVEVHLAYLQRPLDQGVEVFLRDLPVGAQAEVVRHLADVLGLLPRVEHVLQQAVAEVAGLLLGPARHAADPEVVVLVEALVGALGEVRAAAGQPLLERGELLVAVDVDPLVLGLDLILEVVQVLRALLDVDERDDRGGEVEHLLELARGDVEQVADAARHALEEPDVRDGRGEVDVAHALAAHLLPRHLDAAALADDALVADALVLAAVPLPVLRRAENALAEETVTLGLERAVVDRLRLRDLARRPVADLLRRREP